MSSNTDEMKASLSYLEQKAKFGLNEPRKPVLFDVRIESKEVTSISIQWSIVAA
jgi:hypothetical protein